MAKLLRRMEEKDLSSASEIMAEAFKGEPWKEDWTVQECQKRFQEIFSSPMNLSFVLEEEGEILGCCLGLIFTYMDHKEYTIIDFFINQKIQHQHIGSLMMNLVIDKVKKHNIKKITLNTIKGCEEFYEKCAFVINEEGLILEKTF